LKWNEYILNEPNIGRAKTTYSRKWNNANGQQTQNGMSKETPAYGEHIRSYLGKRCVDGRQLGRKGEPKEFRTRNPYESLEWTGVDGPCKQYTRGPGTRLAKEERNW
jgi:hypothetical protein